MRALTPARPPHRAPLRRAAAFVFAACVLGLVALDTARVEPQAAPGQRVVAIGDIHGAATGLAQILQAAGLIDAGRKWTGGTARLVQTGDILDRGSEVREAIDLLMRLEAE